MSEIKTHWQDVHLRLMQALPVRTHYRRPVANPDPHTGRPPSQATMLRRRKITAWLAEGISERDMARRLGISRTAVQKHCRAINEELSK